MLIENKKENDGRTRSNDNNDDDDKEEGIVRKTMIRKKIKQVMVVRNRKMKVIVRRMNMTLGKTKVMRKT